MEAGRALREVWYALVDDEGNAYNRTTYDCIEMDINCAVYKFREAVYDKNASILQGTVPSQLTVYANKIVFEDKGEPLEVNQAPLKSSFVLKGLGVTEEDALIVVVPSISDHSINKRRRILTISDVKDEKDDNWTKWIQSIQNAKVYFVKGDNEKWLDDGTCIQIKRMTFHDDKCIQIKRMTVDDEDTVSVFEHRYEKTLDVVKLPMTIPECLEKRVSQFLFLRPDDYALFYCMQKQKTEEKDEDKLRYILLGNPGISKSWFLFKYILFCFRPEIYNTFRPMKDEDLERKSESKIHELQDVEIGQAFQLHDIETIPNVIVRTLGGVTSRLFYVNPDASVLVVEHLPDDLEFFTKEGMTILWEPGRKQTAIPYIGIKARMIATVSPLLDRFKEFRKNGAQVLHMPCPSEWQLRIMGHILRSISPKLINSDDEVHRRVKLCGPFIRVAVLNQQSNEVDDFMSHRKTELDDISSDKLTKLVTRNEHVMRSSEPPHGGFSHRLARYFVIREDEGPYFGYDIPRFRCASEDAYRAIEEKITKPDISAILKHLINVNKMCGNEAALEEYQYKWFELLVEYYVGDGGLKWERRILQPKQKKQTDSAPWTHFEIPPKEIVYSVVAFDDMKIGSLYVPQILQFPLVDMYWKDENGELCGIQVTKSKNHPKSMQVYQTFLLEKLGLVSIDIKFHLYYVIFPFRKAHYGKIGYSPSFYYEDLKAMSDHPNFGSQFKFYALCPSDFFLSDNTHAEE